MPYQVPAFFFSLLEEAEEGIMLESSRIDSENQRSYLFLYPSSVIVCDSPDTLEECFDRVDLELKAGRYVAGFLSYECGVIMNGLRPRKHTDFPLLRFGMYEEPITFDHRTGVCRPDAGRPSNQPPTLSKPSSISALRVLTSGDEYAEKVNRIKRHIRDGHVYQVNYTTSLCADFTGSVSALYRSLNRKQPVPYAAYMKWDDHSVLSFSPELFFRREGEAVITRPMKGTASRGMTLASDKRVEEWLSNDQKNRAENLMVVDLLRNDLGKVCMPGSVSVPEVFSVEKYRTLFQMTSTVSGTLRNNIRWREIFESLFPSGSITGAPKISAMRIIDGIESGTRGMYTGAIGFISPENRAVFSVAIRTLVVERERLSMGIGGGITIDSEPQDEYEECVLKARFVTDPPEEEFSLFESILWEGRFVFFDEHLLRLRESAEYFEFPFAEEEARSSLRSLEATFRDGEKRKARIFLRRDGVVSIKSERIVEEFNGIGRVAISKERVHSKNRLLYHKTTGRSQFDELLKKARDEGLTDLLFVNERGEVTESAIANIFVRIGNTWITPPVRCGLLDGIYRRHLLATRPGAIERELTVTDVERADELYLCNSVRGLRRVMLEKSS